MSTTTQELLSVAQVARQADVAPSAVRFYDRHGIVTAERTAGNARRFGVHAPCLIKVAKVAQRVGLSLVEIRERLGALPDEPTPDDWAALTAELVDDARRRIAELEVVMADLAGDGKLCEAPRSTSPVGD